MVHSFFYKLSGTEVHSTWLESVLIQSIALLPVSGIRDRDWDSHCSHKVLDCRNWRLSSGDHFVRWMWGITLFHPFWVVYQDELCAFFWVQAELGVHPILQMAVTGNWQRWVVATQSGKDLQNYENWKGIVNVCPKIWI